MAGPNERELKLKLTIEAPDPSKPAKAFQDIAAQANRASLAVQDAQKHMQRMGSGPGSTPGSVPSGVASSVAFAPPGGYRQGAGAGWQAPSAPPQAQRPMFVNASGTATSGIIWGGAGAVSSVSAAERPRPVIIMGPVPLNVRIVEGGSGGRSSANGDSQEASKGPGFMASVGKAAGVIAGVAVITEMVANMGIAFSRLDSQFLTAREKLGGVYRSIPIVGDTFAKIADSVIDAVDRFKNPLLAKELDDMRVTAPRQMRFVDVRTNQAISNAGLIRESRSADNALEAIRENPSYWMSSRLYHGMSTASFSESEMRNMERTKESEAAVVLARRGSEGAFKDAEFTRSEFSRQAAVTADARDRAFRAKTAFDQAERAAINPNRSSGVIGAIGSFATNDLEKKRLEYMVAIKEAQSEIAKLEAAGVANKQNQLAFLQKESEYRKADIGLRRTQLAILKEEEAKVRYASRSFSALDSVSQFAITDAARRFERGGRNFVTANELQQLQQFAPEQIAKKLERDSGGATNPLFEELQRSLGIRDAESLSKEIGKLETSINMSVKFDEEETARSLAKALERINLKELMGSLVSQKFKYEIEQFRIQQAAGRTGG